MADKSNIENGKDYNLEIGSSFAPSKGNAFHLIRYDFKPASVDKTKPSIVKVGNGDNVSLEVPNMQDGGSTAYKGSKRPCTKECILIVNKETGEITLEKLSSGIQLKKIRGSNAAPSSGPSSTPVSQSSNQDLAEDLDDATDGSPPPSATKTPPKPVIEKPVTARSSSLETGSDSSSSDSDSESDDSDHDLEEQGKLLQSSLNNVFQSKPPPANNEVPSSNSVAPTPAKPKETFCQLHEDLQLSESGSDSD